MYSIVTPVPIEKLQNYAIPLNPISQSPDYQFFFSTDEGKEFAKIYPLSVKHAKSKEELKKAILEDITTLAKMYNKQVYIYVLKDSSYKRMLSWNFQSYSNLGTVNDRKLLIEKIERYYFGENSAIKDAIDRKLPKSFKGETMWAYILDKNGLNEYK